MVERARIAVVGIGNTIAGDDGVGVLLAERLADRWAKTEGVLVATLPGDLFSISDLLPLAGRFLFLDAIAGEPVGEIRVLTAAQRAFAPSLHQTDIGSVMAALRKLELADPFPEWEIWGITIDPPAELGAGLTPAVAAAAHELERRVVEYVTRVIAEDPR